MLNVCTNAEMSSVICISSDEEDAKLEDRIQQNTHQAKLCNNLPRIVSASSLSQQDFNKFTSHKNVKVLTLQPDCRVNLKRFRKCKSVSHMPAQGKVTKKLTPIRKSNGVHEHISTVILNDEGDDEEYQLDLHTRPKFIKEHSMSVPVPKISAEPRHAHKIPKKTPEPVTAASVNQHDKPTIKVRSLSTLTGKACAPSPVNSNQTVHVAKKDMLTMTQADNSKTKTLRCIAPQPPKLAVKSPIQPVLLISKVLSLATNSDSSLNSKQESSAQPDQNGDAVSIVNIEIPSLDLTIGGEEDDKNGTEATADTPNSIKPNKISSVMSTTQPMKVTVPTTKQKKRKQTDSEMNQPKKNCLLDRLTGSIPDLPIEDPDVTFIINEPINNVQINSVTVTNDPVLSRNSPTKDIIESTQPNGQHSVIIPIFNGNLVKQSATESGLTITNVISLPSKSVDTSNDGFDPLAIEIDDSPKKDICKNNIVPVFDISSPPPHTQQHHLQLSSDACDISANAPTAAVRENTCDASKTPNTPPTEQFIKFLQICQSDGVSDSDRKFISTYLHRIQKRYNLAEVAYVTSKKFLDSLEEKTRLVVKKPANVIVEFSAIVSELKDNAKNICVPEENPKIRNKIKFYENLLKKLDAKIKSLEETEMGANDDWDDNSIYIQEDRYKRRSVQVYEKLCKLYGHNKNDGRLLFAKLNFKGSKHAPINKAINKYYKKKLEFPNLYEIQKCIKTCVDKNKIELTPEELEIEATADFKAVGQILQKRRQRELYKMLNTQCSTDPAEKDPELATKLRNSLKSGQARISEVFKKYAEKQDRGEDHISEAENSDEIVITSGDSEGDGD